MEKFPDHVDSFLPTLSLHPDGIVSSPTSISPTSSASRVDWAVPSVTGSNSVADQWHPAATRNGGRQALGVRWHDSLPFTRSGRPRQKSLGEAIRTIRSRRASVGQNAHEIVGALRAPVSPKLVVLCVFWYISSALTNTSSKSILNAFDSPATLTLIQFAFVALYCVFFSWLASVFTSLRTSVPSLKYPIRRPSREVVVATLPLAAFQLGGHLLSSNATAKIPVSLVHTIKGLSPLFTVLAYRLVFDIRYPTATYLSLVPLTLGVALACSGKHGFDGRLLGVLYALAATLIFVSQNIFSKRLFNEAARAETDGLGATSRKLDKLNLLCYSSGLAFIITLPIWFWSEGGILIRQFLYRGSVELTTKPDAFDHGRLALEFVFNGSFHFGQNILAFILLSLISPVTYSVASLIKRVFVIVLAMIWFQNPTTKLQAGGIALTFLGLYLYDRTSESNKADRKARMMTDSSPHAIPLLPVDQAKASPSRPTRPGSKTNGLGINDPTVHDPYSPSRLSLDKKTDELAARNGPAPLTWLPPRTHQQDTWQRGDDKMGA